MDRVFFWWVGRMDDRTLNRWIARAKKSHADRVELGEALDDVQRALGKSIRPLVVMLERFLDRIFSKRPLPNSKEQN